jgi:hypothetical protein
MGDRCATSYIKFRCLIIRGRMKNEFLYLFSRLYVQKRGDLGEMRSKREDSSWNDEGRIISGLNTEKLSRIASTR